MAQENDEFSYAYLRNMWAQKEKVASPSQMHKPKVPKFSSKSSNSRKDAKLAKGTGNTVDVRDKFQDVSPKNKHIVDDHRATAVASSLLMTSQSNHYSSADHSCSFQDDITDNLMKLNDNGFVKDSEEDFNAEIITSHEEAIAPVRLWDDNEESYSPKSENRFWDDNYFCTRVSENEVLNENQISHNNDPEKTVRKKLGSKIRERSDNLDQSKVLKESRDSYSTGIGDRNLYDNFDPYDNFESFTVNSEETVKIQNKEAIESVKERKDIPIFPTFDTLGHEEESIIPDSAFESMAARIASNITGSSNVKSRNNEELENCTTQNPIPDSSIFTFTIDEFKDDVKTEQYINAPLPPNRGMSSAESDVFDGLSDIGSMINAFGFLNYDNSNSHQKKQEMEAAFPQELPPTTRSPMERPLHGFPNRILPEKTQDAKRRLVENLASFAKKNTTKQKPIKRRISSEAPYLGQQFFYFTADSGNSLAPVKEDAKDDTCVQNNSSAIETSDCSIGVSPWNQHEFFDAMHSKRSEPVVPQGEDHSMKNTNHHTNKDTTDLLANVTWIPSMIRLYKLQSATSTFKKSPQSTELTQSPNSVVDIKTNDNITYADLILKGFSSILLQRYEIFGGRIADPMSLLRNYPFDVNDNIDMMKKLETHTKTTGGNKRFSLRKKRTKMLDKAVEVHLDGVAKIRMKRFEDAIGIYESFFECYSRREFEAEDVKQEKQLISAFLFNLGIIYAHMDDMNSSMEFLNESLVTLGGHENSSEDVTVSNKIIHYMIIRCHTPELTLVP
jgi:hypothetical protein